MEFKDWLLLLIPVFFNGVIILLLQKIFEKKQIRRTWKIEYVSELVKKIDDSLGLHAKATRLANEGSPFNDATINDTLRLFFDSNLDLYYYYIQNKNIFKSLEDKFENIAKLIMKLSKSANDPTEDEFSISSAINSIRDVLIEIKETCIKL